MNLIKTLIVTLVVYLVANLTFSLIIIYTGALVPSDALYLIVVGMFSPATIAPMMAWADAGIIPIIGGDMNGILTFLYFVLPPLIAIIVGGLVADSSMMAFVSWVFTIAISVLVYIILLFTLDAVSPTVHALLVFYYTLYDPLFLLYYVALILYGIINVFTYGGISFLVTRKKL